MFKKTCLILLSLCLAMIMGCSTANTDNDNQKTQIIEQYKTYAESCIAAGNESDAKVALEEGYGTTNDAGLKEMLDNLENSEKSDSSEQTLSEENAQSTESPESGNVISSLEQAESDENTQKSESVESHKTKKVKSSAVESKNPVKKVKEPENKQIIEVKAKGSSAKLTLKNWENGKWKSVYNTDASIGSKGITKNKVEGDRKTPAGTFDILFYFSLYQYESKLDNFIVNNDTVWVCDPDSVYYNTIQSNKRYYKDWDEEEEMYPKFANHYSEICIAFGFNGNCVTEGMAKRNGGSAIFIDGVGGNGNIDSGYGDIKISIISMEKLIGLLDSDLNPVIKIS